MTVTLTANYTETLSPLIVNFIDRLLDQDYELNAMLEFIDEHNEEDFFEYYEAYVEAGETHGYEAIDLFINEAADLSDLDKFTYAYIGEYSSPARMAEDFLEHEVDRLHYMIVVDWEATAQYLIDHDVDRHGDHYFRTYF
jgi:hypothetical protein